ncbi:TetR/AcrR family transcriptional regulator [Mycobacterium heidelbergense]|uniref:TetR family transcriptional regulator n=1 Tax=Mycobacterium heidelbergense TaxID=53376 RepID=A0A1X0DG43_MYCHE|nr:TetR/AcrR family transcriptional regulator [Mycobacterium heidelbergense]MCV7050853.1 TetR/AcrR family transcriptional regulator [Mycobacterium heidelbergense]ORA71139.1 TetR family transcriptional regulator [Mycobacterium heidelbergense]BBZ51116.1 hypothetical protein MHEI_28330 [Mycobacterium heidelbergense]
MTSSQLKRRAKIVDAVIDMVTEAGADTVQMRDVAQRSGMALATVYKYFSSKEDLLAAALDSWQNREAEPILSGDEPPDQDPVSGIVDYLWRSQRSAHANPELTALTLQLTISTERGAKAAIDHLIYTNTMVFKHFLADVAPEDLRRVGFGLGSAFTSSLIWLLTGRMTLEESQSHVEWVVRVLLGETQQRVQKQVDIASRKLRDR